VLRQARRAADPIAVVLRLVVVHRLAVDGPDHAEPIAEPSGNAPEALPRGFRGFTKAGRNNERKQPPGAVADDCAHMKKKTRKPAAPGIAPEPHAPLLRREIEHLDPLLAYMLVRGTDIAVLLVGPFGPPRLDLVLNYVQKVQRGAVGWVDINEIDLSHDATRVWIDAQHERLGRPAGASVRPGYYLFCDGQVRAYHPGLIDFKRDKLSIGFGLVAALAALYAHNIDLLSDAFRVASLEASARVLLFFDAVITGKQSHAAPQTPPAVEPAIDEVGVAFDVLGLAPSAPHPEVKARFRALAKEWHPDRFTKDDPKSAEAGIRMSQINVAYSVICEARGW